MRCVHWKNGVWSSEGMNIGPDSSIDGNVQCFTYHFSLFRSSVFVLPKPINLIEDIKLFSTIADNMVCLLLVLAIFFIFFVVLYWSSVQDKRDITEVRMTLQLLPPFSRNDLVRNNFLSYNHRVVLSFLLTITQTKRKCIWLPCIRDMGLDLELLLMFRYN